MQWATGPGRHLRPWGMDMWALSPGSGQLRFRSSHYNDVIMSAMASQITSLTIVYSTVYLRRRSKKTSKLRVTGLCEGNSPVTGRFPAQMGSNAENVSIWWRHHATELLYHLWAWLPSQYKTVFSRIGSSITKIRRSGGRLFYNENARTRKTTSSYWNGHRSSRTPVSWVVVSRHTPSACVWTDPVRSILFYLGPLFTKR